MFIITIYAATFGIFGRGVMQFVMPQATAYVVQIGLFCIMACALLLTGGARIDTRRSTLAARRISYGSFLFFVAVICLSIAVTLTEHFSEYFWLYPAIVIFFAICFLFFISLEFEARWSTHLAYAFWVVTMVMSLVSFAEHAGIFMPGQWTIFGEVRPAGTTGSKQHFGIAIAILAIVMVHLYSVSARKIFLAAAAIAAMASAFSFTRSSYLILVASPLFAMCFALLPQPQRIRFHPMRAIVLVLGIALVVVLVSLIFGDTVVKIVGSRFVSIFDLDSTGNVNRLGAWLRGIDIILDGPILIGAETGAVTQAAQRLFGEGSTHVESGLIQIVANFGLLGLLAFTLQFTALILRLPPHMVWLRGLLVACYVQSFVYMSVEVIPFMLALSLLPALEGYRPSLRMKRSRDLMDGAVPATQRD